MLRPGATKRQKELARQEHQREKQAKKAERATNKEKRAREDGVDPDLVGIVPGPQPIPEE